MTAIQMIGAGRITGVGAMGLSEMVEAGEFLDLVAQNGVFAEEFSGH